VRLSPAAPTCCTTTAARCIRGVLESAPAEGRVTIIVKDPGAFTSASKSPVHSVANSEAEGKVVWFVCLAQEFHFGWRKRQRGFEDETLK